MGSGRGGWRGIKVGVWGRMGLEGLAPVGLRSGELGLVELRSEGVGIGGLGPAQGFLMP